MMDFSILLAQTAEMSANEPNWTVIGTIAAVMIGLAALLLLPVKDSDAGGLTGEGHGEIGAPKEPKALTGDVHEAGDEPADGQQAKSLVEIRESKHAAVSGTMTKEELRELRKERRASVQTEKAVDALATASAAQALASEEPATEELAAEGGGGADESAAEVADKVSEQTDTANEAVKPAADGAQSILGEDGSGKQTAAEVFASLFGEDTGKGGGLDLENLEGGESEDSKPKADSGPVFPMLGSKLIPLNELTAKPESADDEIDPLDELTKSLAAKAEKKTLN